MPWVWGPVRSPRPIRPAILRGNWGPDQTVEATARISATDATYYQEIELRYVLRSARTINGDMK
jgi:hypothetical protein